MTSQSLLERLGLFCELFIYFYHKNAVYNFQRIRMASNNHSASEVLAVESALKLFIELYSTVFFRLGVWTVIRVANRDDQGWPNSGPPLARSNLRLIKGNDRML